MPFAWIQLGIVSLAACINRCPLTTRRPWLANALLPRKGSSTDVCACRARRLPAILGPQPPDVKKPGTKHGGTYVDETHFSYEGGQSKSLLSLIGLWVEDRWRARDPTAPRGRALRHPDGGATPVTITRSGRPMPDGLRGPSTLSSAIAGQIDSAVQSPVQF